DLGFSHGFSKLWASGQSAGGLFECSGDENLDAVVRHILHDGSAVRAFAVDHSALKLVVNVPNDLHFAHAAVDACAFVHPIDLVAQVDVKTYDLRRDRQRCAGAIFAILKQHSRIADDV